MVVPSHQLGLVIGGSKTITEITTPYDNLTKRHGVKVIKDRVNTIDADKRIVKLAGGTELSYDRLIVSPGVDFMWESLPGMNKAGAKEKAGRMALLSHAQRAGMRAMGAMWARPMVHPAVVGGPVFEQVLAMLERSSPAQFAAQINALLTRPDAAPVLAGITCPTLVLTGRQDAWSPPEQHQAMVDAMHAVRAELVVLEDCGHMSTMEQPDAVNAAFACWLAA